MGPDVEDVMTDARLDGAASAVERRVRAPTLDDLKTKVLTTEELQAAVLKLVELYNEQGKIMDDAIRDLRRYRESRREVDLMNTPYGL